jgi:hypothetical protein
MPEICTHILCSHEEPRHVQDHYDNLSLLVAVLKSLLITLSNAYDDQDGDVSDVAYLGYYLCEEIDRRVEALYHCKAGKEVAHGA